MQTKVAQTIDPYGKTMSIELLKILGYPISLIKKKTVYYFHKALAL